MKVGGIYYYIDATDIMMYQVTKIIGETFWLKWLLINDEYDMEEGEVDGPYDIDIYHEDIELPERIAKLLAL